MTLPRQQFTDVHWSLHNPGTLETCFSSSEFAFVGVLSWLKQQTLEQDVLFRRFYLYRLSVTRKLHQLTATGDLDDRMY